MANQNIPHGFRPVRSNAGGVGQPKISYFTLAAANSAIGLGDALIMSSGDVDIATASAALIGIAAEAKAASTGGKIAVWADPQQEFEGQTDDGTGVATSAVLAIGKNINLVATAPSAGKSKMELDESSAATTATLPFKIIGLYTDPQNAYGEFNRLVVKINNHVLGSHTGTVGS
jgi:hypothetical protein